VSGSGGGAGGSGGARLRYDGTLLERKYLCKLISNEHIDDPTANHTQTRFNLRGADLGVPVVSGDELLLLFGDTVGYKAIWDFGEDPDSVGRVPLASVLADPAALCDELDFYVTPDVPSVAHGQDPAIERDFAGAWMAPPGGEAIGAYLAQPAGPFASMPGTFEVPGGALSLGGGAVMAFYAGLVETSPETRATSSFLARWDSPATTGPNYQIVRRLDSLAGGALGGHFIQAAPVAIGDAVYLYGTGNYRRSGVYLARVPAAALESGEGQELYDPAAGQFVLAAALTQAEREAVSPIFETDGVGELSLVWVEAAGVLVALYQRQAYGPGGGLVDNRVVARVAPGPTGPWSDAVTITDMADPIFRALHCCGATCPGAQILHCEKAGLYGAYLLPTVKTTPAGGDDLDLELPMLVSTWDPYNVALFSARVRMTPR
jgi:hypothetical protein